MKKEWRKKLGFVLFVMAAFFVGVALFVLEPSPAMVCIAGGLLLLTSLFYVLQWEDKASQTSDRTTELLLADRMAELMRGNEKAEKGVYIAVKKQHEAMESGMEALNGKLSEMITAQENAVKTLVLYNKENAKQLALNERDEMEQLRATVAQLQQEVKTAQKASIPIVDAVKEMSRRLYEEMHENDEAMLSELGAMVDSMDELKNMIRELLEKNLSRYEQKASEVQKPMFEDVSEAEAMTEEVLPEESSVENFVPEETVEPEPVAEEAWSEMTAESEPVAEEAWSEMTVEPEPVAEEDIPEEGMHEEIPTEEQMAEEMPEDPFASSGVDLSDPNKTLSPDEIAALIASLGN